ncbi:HeH/LEM domain-containing protein [Acinetobacter sp. NigerLNRRAM0016]
MKIIYAKNGEKIQHDGQIHNPDYYDKPVVKAKSVVIYGDYPKIKADYEAINIEVEVLEVAKNNLEQGEPADLSGLVPVEQFDAVALDLSNTKEQLSTAQGEQIAFKNDVGAMKARIAELEPADADTPKPTDYSSMTADQLRALLDEKEIKYLARDNKDTLISLLEQPVKTEE